MNDAEKQASSSEKNETCGGGSSAACLRCPYHGWTYDLTGRLVRASRLGGTEDFDAAENGLVPLAAETLGPFVFLYVGTEARNDEDAERSEEVSRGASRASRPPSVREWLGEAVASELELAGIIPRVVSEAHAQASDDAASDATLRSGAAASSVADDSSAETTTTPSMTRVARREFSVACNWKVFCDNYLDGGYHVPFAHPALAEGVDMRTYRTTWAEARGHATQTVGGGFRARGVETGEEGSSSATTTTVSDDANGTSRGGGRRKGGRRKGAFFDGSSRKTRGSGSSSDDNDDPGRLGDGGASYVFLYPNFMINRYGPWMDTNLVVPTGPETCVVVFEYWLETERLGGWGAERFVAESLKASEVVQREDEWLCEKVQEGMRSPVWRPGRYVAAVEGAMYNFHRKLWEDMTDDE
jgi:choline monooxygenase